MFGPTMKTFRLMEQIKYRVSVCFVSQSICSNYLRLFVFQLKTDNCQSSTMYPYVLK